MTHASLFSGIGGFDLAAEWAGWTNVFNCEIDNFCQKVLRYHFPDTIQYSDVKTTDFTVHRGGGMSSREDFPANRSASQENAKELTITATSGRRCCEQFERLPLVGSWAKMFSVSLIGRREWYSSRCALIWRMQTTRCNRILFRLVPSMRRTAEIECGSSPIVGMMPTPISSEIAHPARVEEQINKGRTSLREREKGEAGPNGLTDFLMFNGLIPTVVTQGLKYCNRKGQSAFVKAEMLPTPKAQDERHALHDRGRSNLGEEIAERYGDGSSMGSQLNPLFVAEMMGFPVEHTLTPFQERKQWIELG